MVVTISTVKEPSLQKVREKSQMKGSITNNSNLEIHYLPDPYMCYVKTSPLNLEKIMINKLVDYLMLNNIYLLADTTALVVLQKFN